MSKFALQQMEKFGWKEGEGLGKDKQGISTAVKADIKRDSFGVGKVAEDFGFQWWDHCFNRAAKNLVVKQGEDGVSLKQKKIEISDKKPQAAGPKCMLYGNFVQSKSANNNEILQQDDSHIDYTSKISSKEVFLACGGRTAHKGARHGIKQKGKLKRVNDLYHDEEEGGEDDLKTKSKKRPKTNQDENESGCSSKKSNKNKKGKKNKKVKLDKEQDTGAKQSKKSKQGNKKAKKSSKKSKKEKKE